MYDRTKKMVMTAMLAALVCVATMIIKIQLTPNGYINLGDGVILLASSTLGSFYGFFAAAIGSALADLLSGFVVYAPATFFIKGLMAVAAFYVMKKTSKLKNATISVITAAVVAEIVMILGYYIFESILYGFETALLSMPGNAIQAVAGIVTGVLLVRTLSDCIS